MNSEKRCKSEKCKSRAEKTRSPTLAYEKDDEWKMYIRRMMRNGWYGEKKTFQVCPLWSASQGKA